MISSDTRITQDPCKTIRQKDIALKSLRSQNQWLKQKLSKKQANAQEFQKASRQRQQLRNKVKHYEQSLEKINTMLIRITETSLKQSTEAKQLREQNATLKTTVAHLNQQVKVFQEEYQQEQESRKEQSKQELLNLLVLNQKQENQNYEFSRRIDNLQNENKILTLKLQQAQQQNKQKSHTTLNQLQQSKLTNQTLQTQLNQQSQKLQTKDRLLQQKLKSLLQTKKQLQQKQQKIDLLQMQSQEYRTIIQVQEKKIAELQHEKQRQNSDKTNKDKGKLENLRKSSLGQQDIEGEESFQSVGELLPAKIYVKDIFPENRQGDYRYNNHKQIDYVLNRRNIFLSEEGFLLDHSNIYIDLNIFLKHDWSSVQRLFLTNTNMTNHDWSILVQNVARFPNLKILKLDKNNLEQIEPEELDKFPSLQLVFLQKDSFSGKQINKFKKYFEYKALKVEFE